MQHKWKKRLLALMAGLLVLTGGITVAATQGTADNPLVTLDYLTEIVTPSVLEDTQSKVDSAKDTYESNLDAKITAYTKEMEGLSANEGSHTAMLYEVVELDKGQTLEGTMGCEVVLRQGSAVSVASDSDGLVDSTAGGALKNGSALVKDHLYLVSAQSIGVQATSSVTLLVRGSYSIED